MTPTKNAIHEFDLCGLSPSDTFLGCAPCKFRLEPGEVSAPICPECGQRMGIFTMTEENDPLVKNIDEIKQILQ